MPSTAFARVALAIVASVALVACNGQESSSPASRQGQARPSSAGKPSDAGSAKSARSAKASAGDSQSTTGSDAQGAPTGHLAGTVRFTGQTIPEPTRIPVGTDPQFCGSTIAKENVAIDAESRGVRWVLVWLQDKGLEKASRAEPAHLVLDNRQCQFAPHAAVLTVGSIIEVRNSDPITHTTHGYLVVSTKARALSIFNPSLPQKRSETYVLDRPGLLKIICDLHGWMEAWIRVDRHPFHAVTDEQGRFRIENIPAGSYNVRVRHEYFGEQEHAVTIDAAATAKLDLTYSNTEP